MSDDRERRWEDSPVVKQLKLWLWPALIGLCTWFVHGSYADLKERVSSAESKALEVSRSSDRMGVQVDSIAVEQRALRDQVSTGFKRMEDRLDRIVDSNPRRSP